MEVEAGNVALFFVTLLIGTDQINDDKRKLFSSLEQDVNRRSLGHLLRQIRKLMNFDETIIGIIDEALDRRDYLTHHFFRVHNFAVFSKGGRQEMIKELEEIQRTLITARSYLSAISSMLGKQAGIQEAEIQQLIESGKKITI